MRYVELYDSLRVSQDVLRMSALVHGLRQSPPTGCTDVKEMKSIKSFGSWGQKAVKQYLETWGKKQVYFKSLPI